jgi:thymidylate synthase (FAD)
LGDAPIAEASDIEAVYYLRPVGSYCCPNSGRRYSYIEADREQDLAYCLTASRRYARAIAGGLSSEQARALLPFDLRQHFVVSFNLRSLMHFLDLRSKADAQLEIQALCDMIYPHFEVWAPQVATWYGANRLGKAKLAP